MNCGTDHAATCLAVNLIHPVYRHAVLAGSKQVNWDYNPAVPSILYSDIPNLHVVNHTTVHVDYRFSVNFTH